MYKNLSCELLGISGRQSEIIELAMTYGFSGIDIDIKDLVKRCERSEFESAARFLNSSKLRVGGFEIPVDLDSDEDTYAAELAKLANVAEIAGKAKAEVGILTVPNQTDRLPYPEYFDVIRKRISEITAIFAEANVKTAITFNPSQGDEEKEFKFVQDAENFVALANSCKPAGIVYDSWAWFCGGGTAELFDSVGAERVFAVRLADCVEGVSGSAATEADQALPGSTGVIDVEAYLRKLVEADCDIAASAIGSLSQVGGKRDAFIGKTQEALNNSLVQAGLPSNIRTPDSYSETPEAPVASNEGK